MKHTPRPWRWVAWGKTIQIDAPTYSAIALIVPRRNYDYGIPSKRDKANAQLITAAPELLETGSLLIRTINDTLRHWNQPSQRQALEECAKQFLAVLRKAEGRK